MSLILNIVAYSLSHLNRKRSNYQIVRILNSSKIMVTILDILISFRGVKYGYLFVIMQATEK